MKETQARTGRPRFPRTVSAVVDWQVLAACAATAAFVGIAAGLIPAAGLFRSNLSERLNQASRRASAGAGVRRLSSGLVVVQVAAAAVLLVASALLLRSFHRATTIDVGFDARDMYTGRIAIPPAYRSAKTSGAFLERLLRTLRELPGVTEAALSTSVPGGAPQPIAPVWLPDHPPAPGETLPGVSLVAVSQDYLATMRLRLVAGSWFERLDAEAREKPNAPMAGPHLRGFVVDRALAERYLPGRDPIGTRLAIGGLRNDEIPPIVIGVVETVPHAGIEERSPLPVIYGSTFSHIPGAIYVLAYDVAQRRRELGIRAAIGATPSVLLRMVLSQGLARALAGTLLGTLAAVGVSKLIASLLFDVRPDDITSYLASAALLLATAALASAVPARRAALADPVTALRSNY